jgi:3'-5' exonuclease
MLNHISLHSILCLDIETVPQYPEHDHVPPAMQKLWSRKTEFLRRKDPEINSNLYERAGIYAEFGKVVCISTGHLINRNGNRKLRLQSFYGDDENDLLQCFSTFLNEFDDDVILCAHNGKEFDFPYLCRRMIVNGIELPGALQISGKKPWEVNHLDTMELWKFGDYKHYTPLSLLANIFQIDDPKDDMDGSEVHHTYWKEKDLEKIERYCNKDVITVMQILLKMKGERLLEKSEIRNTD